MSTKDETHDSSGSVRPFPWKFPFISIEFESWGLAVIKKKVGIIGPEGAVRQDGQICPGSQKVIHSECMSPRPRQWDARDGAGTDMGHVTQAYHDNPHI